MKTALVCGAGGFIGGHLVKRLKREGFWVRGVDLKFNEYAETEADDFVLADLRDPYLVRQVVDRRFDEIYQLAADMGGAGYIFTGDNDADVMHNSATINLNVLKGDMSLVGPRPHALAHDQYYSEQLPGYAARMQAKPGLTGLAQVSGNRGEIRELDCMARRVAYDVAYIDDWSPLLDIKLLALTLARAPFDDRAY